jgi:hypothetical protein
MKSALFISALLLASVLSYGQRQDSVLMRAYQTKSIATLSKFFNQWADETPSLSAAEREMLNDTLQNVYALFEQFYNPLDLKKVGGSEWGNDIYKKAHFLLVQDVSDSVLLIPWTKTYYCRKYMPKPHLT